jgi:hypothetical protein
VYLISLVGLLGEFSVKVDRRSCIRMPHQWKESFVVPTKKRAIKLTAVIIKVCHC